VDQQPHRGGAVKESVIDADVTDPELRLEMQHGRDRPFAVKPKRDALERVAGELDKVAEPHGAGDFSVTR
jgi:hypothetical protein